MDEPHPDESRFAKMNFGPFKIPTVVSILRNILTQYPDNGQIIKELVQNAEDAGATFLDLNHEKRDLHLSPNSDLWFHKYLQSPAIALHNDAIFTPDDWKGIEQICESIKKSDPLKIGRFGLGFKSVFHITDYVTIVSGCKLLMLNPLEHESRMCCSLELLDLTKYISVDDCLTILGHYLTHEHLSVGFYPGSLFWFPMRQKTSLLSETIYTSQHLESLFASFATEASLSLTFLRSLRRITLRKGDECCYQVSLDADKDLQLKRLQLNLDLERISNCETIQTAALSCSYEISVDTIKEGVASQQRFFVLHYLPPPSDHFPMSQLSNSGPRIPLVGIAAPLTRQTVVVPQGGIFCFLPLPSVDSNVTGLPVHVNGLFILDQSRHHVKWRCGDSTKDETDVEWNELLVQQVLSEAMFAMLTNLLAKTVEGDIKVYTWYRMLPDMNRVQGRWQEMARKVWQNLLQLEMFYSKVVDKFFPWNEIVIKNSSGTTSKIVMNSVIEVLNDLKIPYLELPIFLQKNFELLGYPLRKVSPCLLRKYLREASCFLRHWNLLNVLEFIMEDGNYKDLQEIRMLPLQDGTWTTFTTDSNSSFDASVYVCAAHESVALYGHQNYILALHLNPCLLDHFANILKAGKNSVFMSEIKHAKLKSIGRPLKA